MKFRLPFFEYGCQGLNCSPDHVAQVEIFLLQFDSAASDARNVQQIIEKPRHVPRLPLDDLPRFVDVFRFSSRRAHDSRGADNSRQRVPKLMRKHRQKFFTPPGRRANFVFRAFAIGDVEESHHDTGDLIAAPDRITPVFGSERCAIGPRDDFCIGVRTFACAERNVNRAILLGVARVQEVMNLTSDQVVRGHVAEHADTRRVHEGARAVGAETDNAFRSRLQQQPDSPLALADVPLRFPELRDVAADQRRADNTGFRIVDWRDRDRDVAQRTVFVQAQYFDLFDAFAAAQRIQKSRNLVLASHWRQSCDVPANEFFTVMAVDALRSPVP